MNTDIIPVSSPLNLRIPAAFDVGAGWPLLPTVTVAIVLIVVRRISSLFPNVGLASGSLKVVSIPPPGATLQNSDTTSIAEEYSTSAPSMHRSPTKLETREVKVAMLAVLKHMQLAASGRSVCGQLLA